MSNLKRFAVPLVLVILVITASIAVLTGGASERTVVAYFPRTLSLYEGSDVSVLGIPVGRIQTIEPKGDQVKVTMTVPEDLKLPADASAVIVAPSIIGNRYIQLTPAYSGGKTLAKDAVLWADENAVPLELDEIFGSIDELTVALGPTGANKKGALSDLLEQTAANFGGQGAKFHQTIEDFSKLSRTLDNNKEELFGSARALEGFVKTLADNDSTVRDFNSSLSDVSDLLAGERQELSTALSNLSGALTEVGRFVRDNRDSLTTNIKGLDRVSKVLVKQRAALDESLKTAPVALSNLLLTYNPQAGTLDTNANLGNLVTQATSNPAGLLCALLASNDPKGNLCKLVTGVLGRSAPFIGAGATRKGQAAFDPTLNGLVG